MKQNMQWQIGPPTLTKLEYFAGLIMATGPVWNYDSPTTQGEVSRQAKYAVIAAKALIAELEKEQYEVMT